MSKEVKGKIEVVHSKYAYKKKVIALEGNPNIVRYVHSELSQDGIQWLMKGLTFIPSAHHNYDVVNTEELLQQLEAQSNKIKPTKGKSYIFITMSPCTQAK
ncbi:MAG: hypothetical protein RSC49_08250 [Clostridium sp.]